MVKASKKETEMVSKNEIKENLNFYNVEVISSNLNIGGEIYQKGARIKVSSLQGLEHFTKII